MRAAHVTRSTRLIPAHAGKTSSFRYADLSVPAHPRSRGENLKSATLARSVTGSSPLTRGKRVRLSRAAAYWRLIPAHAGKTGTAIKEGLGSAAHPRSRGENQAQERRRDSRYGSSPLTRGKLQCPQKAGVCERLIPAHAGKTMLSSGPGSRAPAHPRSRGENGAFGRARSCTMGSSPLTRGKRLLWRLVSPRHRLIPAHAGKTLFPPESRSLTAAHPRSRGENVEHDTEFNGACRLIPAHAGKTSCNKCVLYTRWAHPRSRGENLPKDATVREMRGSSPLTRGKLVVKARGPEGAGLIPAHAGKTKCRPRSVGGLPAHPRSRGENTS